MTAAEALLAARSELAYTSDPAKAAQTLSVAAARGVDPADLERLRADWEALYVATVVQLPRPTASIPAHLRTDTLPDYLRQKGEL